MARLGDGIIMEGYFRPIWRQAVCQQAGKNLWTRMNANEYVLSSDGTMILTAQQSDPNSRRALTFSRPFVGSSSNRQEAQGETL